MPLLFLLFSLSMECATAVPGAVLVGNTYNVTSSMTTLYGLNRATGAWPFLVNVAGDVYQGAAAYSSASRLFFLTPHSPTSKASKIISSADGVKWTDAAVDKPLGDGRYFIAFSPSGQLGFVVADGSAAVARSGDGGVSWTHSTLSVDAFSGVSFLNETHLACAAAKGGVVLVSSDGGITFTKQTVPVPSGSDPGTSILFRGITSSSSATLAAYDVMAPGEFDLITTYGVADVHGNSQVVGDTYINVTGSIACSAQVCFGTPQHAQSTTDWYGSVSTDGGATWQPEILSNRLSGIFNCEVAPDGTPWIMGRNTPTYYEEGQWKIANTQGGPHDGPEFYGVVFGS